MATTQQNGTGFKTANVMKYDHRRLEPNEFLKLRLDAGVSPRDFLFMTGRHSKDLGRYEGLVDSDPRRGPPMMSEVLILELIKRHPEMHDIMIGICNEYSLGPRPQPSRKEA